MNRTDKRNLVIIVLVLAIGGLTAILTGCAKTTTVVINPGSEITTTVSFSKTINPIFTNNCALSGCHVAGGHAPNLTAANAYQSLTTGGYVKPGDPDNSVLMQYLTGQKQPAMPLGSGPNSEINAQVYAWINQGAQNN